MEQELYSKKKEIIDFFLKKDILIGSDLLEHLAELDPNELQKNIFSKIKSADFLVLNKDLNDLLAKHELLDTNWFDIEKSLVLLEKGKDNKLYKRMLDFLSAETKETKQEEQKINILFSYEEESKKRDIQDFVQYFNERYKTLEKILRNRQELKNILSISRALSKKDRDNISLIGMVKDKETTKNKNIILTIEDPTGAIKVLINKNKPELYGQAKDIVLDEVIGINGVNGQNIIFANNILWPDIPSDRKIKKSPDEAYALFLSDLHVGSKNFLLEDFDKFIKWINREMGNEKQKEIAEKTKYIFIIGDLIDGCGVYPEQDKELAIKDIYLQYEACAELLKQIPRNINLIICPGNHDAMRIAEPQPPLYKDFAKPLYQLPNATLVSNPSLVNIHSSKDFSGFDVLLYHGYSFDYFISEVESIRNNGGYYRADLVMKIFLQRRHLAPTHTSTLYIPETTKDPLTIEKIPDIFATGHIHKSIASHYKSITLICGSCWQSKTAFQEKVGHNPEPSRVPIVNLKTREAKILKFGK